MVDYPPPEPPPEQPPHAMAGEAAGISGIIATNGLPDPGRTAEARVFAIGVAATAAIAVNIRTAAKSSETAFARVIENLLSKEMEGSFVGRPVRKLLTS